MRLNAVTLGGDGPPIVLLHGLFGASRNLHSLQKALATDGHRVVALDLRNHGDSPHAKGMSYDEMAADVRETLGAMSALPCALLGHSMGGKVAMRLALDQPTLVSRLVVADIAPRGYRHGNREIAAAMLALPLHPGMIAPKPIRRSPMVWPIRLPGRFYCSACASAVRRCPHGVSVCPRSLAVWRPSRGGRMARHRLTAARASSFPVLAPPMSRKPTKARSATSFPRRNSWCCRMPGIGCMRRIRRVSSQQWRPF